MGPHLRGDGNRLSKSASGASRFTNSRSRRLLNVFVGSITAPNGPRHIRMMSNAAGGLELPNGPRSSSRGAAVGRRIAQMPASVRRSGRQGGEAPVFDT